MSPPTPASSAFRFAEPVEYDFSMTGAVLGVFSTDGRVGIVGVDLWCVRLKGEGEMGEGVGVGSVTDSAGALSVELPCMLPRP